MRKNEIPQNFTLSLFPFGLGIGFASLAHPCLGILLQEIRNRLTAFQPFFIWIRDWLRFARPSLFGVPLQETRMLSRFPCFVFYPPCERALSQA